MNPFQPNDDEENFILGEGGYNSGRTLEDYNASVTDPARKVILTRNAQRIYRNRNREAYNANQNALWNKNKKEENESYNNWLKSQKKANAKYRLKKRLQELESNQVLPKSLTKLVNQELDDLWKELPKSDKKNTRKADFKDEYRSDITRDVRREEINRIKKLLGNDSAFKYTYVPVEDKTGLNSRPKRERKLITGFTPEGKVETAPLPQLDPEYNQLALGKTADKIPQNLKALNAYYRQVLTAQEPIDNKQFGSDKTPKQLADLADKRTAHYENLNAGAWLQDNRFNKKKTPDAGFTKEELIKAGKDIFKPREKK